MFHSQLLLTIFHSTILEVSNLTIYNSGDSFNGNTDNILMVHLRIYMYNSQQI